MQAAIDHQLTLLAQNNPSQKVAVVMFGDEVRTFRVHVRMRESVHVCMVCLCVYVRERECVCSCMCMNT